MAESGPRVFEDERFGRIVVTPGSPLVVEGERIGRFTRWISVEQSHEWMTPQGGGTTMLPRALITRASNDERIKLEDGRVYRLRHTGGETARVEVDGTVVAELVSGGGGVPIRDSKRALYEVSWTPHTDATAVGVTHLLASRYGAGAPGFWANVLPF